MYCPECGHHNREVARFCVRCGASLLEPDPNAETTMSFTVAADSAEETGVLETVVEGPTLVIRSGGGREGEAFPVANDRTTIGRAPSCDVFLDDITVSRNHAVLERDPAGVRLVDQGSLNGTYVNRERVDRIVLGDGDEVQVGKYRLTYITR